MESKKEQEGIKEKITRKIELINFGGDGWIAKDREKCLEGYGNSPKEALDKLMEMAYMVLS